jgi:starch-binding outer membrane protein, SusD/RagB family
MFNFKSTNMKNLKNIILILLFGSIIFSCENFLNEQPISNESVANYFSSSEEFEIAVNGVYASLRGITNNYPILSEMRSDNSTHQFNNVNRSIYPYWDLDKFIMSTANSIPTNHWNSCYDGIARCNSVLHYLENQKQEIKNRDRYIAEVKFIRAFTYFSLLRYFGNIPLITKKIETYSDAFEQNKQVPQDKIYEQIISDLNDAKINLPKSYSEEEGRITEGAARTLLGKVLMWQGRFGDAASEFEAILNSQKYSLLNDYSSVFNINNENNKEIIFSIQNIEGPYGLSSNYMYRFTPWNAGTHFISHGPDVAGGGLNIPTENLLKSFEKGDKRKAMIDTSFIDHTRYVYNDSIVPVTKKYMDTDHQLRGQTGANMPIFRYPHVLLMLAECYVREGGGDPALLVNEVRERAGLPELPSITLDDIIHERRIEFHCESDRWDVLVRTGLAKEVMEAHGEKERKRPYIEPNSYTNVKLLYPIPDDEISLDPNLEQNPEYQ